MDNETGEVFRKLKKDLTAYVEVKLDLLKLSTYERTSKVLAVLSYGILLLLLAFFATLFIFLALGMFIGELIHSVSGGFAIVVLIYLLAILVIYIYRISIKNKIQNVIISALMANDDNDDDNDKDKTNTTEATDPIGDFTW